MSTTTRALSAPLRWVAAFVSIAAVLTFEVCRAAVVVTFRATLMCFRLLWDMVLCFIPFFGWAVLAHRGFTWQRRHAYTTPLWPHWRLRPAWTR